MPPKKSSQDTTNKGILTLRNHVSTPIHKPIVTHNDLAIILAKFINNLINESNSIDKKTSQHKESEFTALFWLH